MFADDIALYYNRVIKGSIDCSVLQGDVDSIGELVANKHLEFLEMPSIMDISRKRQHSIPLLPLYLNGTQLNQVTSYKYT